MFKTPILSKREGETLSTTQVLVLSCLFSCGLLCIRMIMTGHLSYLFLVWNLFLAYIPYAITSLLQRYPVWVASRWRFVLASFTWLLFVPNSFYILTDFFHLDRFGHAPQWFDLLLLFSFTWNGLLLGILSIRKMQWFFELRLGHPLTLLLLFLVMVLNALGIFIGRYLRYNSWDIVTQPGSLFADVYYLLRHPLRHSMEWGMISLYAVFMLLFYLTIQSVTIYFLKHTEIKEYGKHSI